MRLAIGDASFEAAGDSEAVMRAFEDFKILAMARSTPSPKGPASAARNNGGGDHSNSDMPLAVFVKRAFSSQAAKATAIVMWARDHEGKSALKPSDIEAHWRKTTGKVPANPSQVCATAVTHGWLHNEGGGMYSVTGHGEALVSSTPAAA